MPEPTGAGVRLEPDARLSLPSAFPWDAAMRFCLGRLGWTPATFWAVTPRELAAALPRPPDRSAPARRDLEALIVRYGE